MRKSAKNSKKVLAQRKRALVKTTFLELIGNLIDRTPDDTALIASVKRIFDISDVRVVRSLAPLRLVAKEGVSKANRRARFGKARPAWA
ncbi:MAG: hypothetical protein ACREP3_10330 [Candidatus Binatia bacterium]